MKKFFILLGIVAMTATAYGQADTDIVNIPDENFREFLLNNTDINTDKNNYITYAEARAYTGELKVNNKNITSLKGIEAFIKLRRLICSFMNITSLDLSKNTALEFLDCSNGKLTSLDVSGATALKELYCPNNQLTNLDVSKNTALTRLVCPNNQLSSLDVSGAKALTFLSCANNQLTQLNINNGNNVNLRLSAFGNPNLMCIQIDRGYISKSSWYKDRHAVYKYDCNYPALSTNEKSLAKEIKVINPVQDNLIIKTDAKVERIEIYNTAGQLVKVLFKGNTNVQDLTKGIYLIKITTDQGVRTEKIVKQ